MAHGTMQQSRISTRAVRTAYSRMSIADIDKVIRTLSRIRRKKAISSDRR